MLTTEPMPELSADAEREAPFQLRVIDHIVLRVSDLERSIAFYCAALGCTLDRRRPEYGLVHLRAGESMIDLVVDDDDAESATHPQNVDHFCLRIAPFAEEAILSHLASHGAAMELPVGERYGAQGTGRSLYVRDPDGNRIELKEVLPRQAR